MEYYKKGEVAVINCENKLLPFRNQKYFKNAMVRAYKTEIKVNSEGKPVLDENGKQQYNLGFIQALEQAIENNDVKCIVVESFTRVCDLLEMYLDNKLKIAGFEKWGYYLKELERVLLTISGNSKKPIIWTALPEITLDSDGIKTETVAVSGKLKGKVESYFEIVLRNYVDNKASNSIDKYRFALRSDGKHGAKVPFELFDENITSIPNDINLVLNKIREMYGVGIYDDFHYPNIMILAPSGFGKSSSLRNLVKEEEEKTNATTENK